MKLRLACLALVALALTGCSGVRSMFGLDRNPPDEFRVVQRAPLEMPRQLDLPPPRPGAVRPQEGTAADQAAAVVFSQAAAGGPAAGLGNGQGLGTASLSGLGGNGSDGAAAASAAGLAALRGRQAPTTASPAEKAFLARAGAERADPNVRTAVNQEALTDVDSGKSWLDTILWWRTPDQPGTVVDPTREAQRLRGVSAAGQGVTTGETPQVQRRRRAPLEGLF
ncbi:DUF3035 domain-containing protein [Arenibaculum pallidiluteum]|uniref:DUF3035 domain-containing protein n=1 Tax=Arenibaculum pallidiluteum TaxID=2812559 RepID=UPI001A972ADF|nr:DUF3035 domain-containing protein [Arenibaculum pallidiluteum]